MYNYKMHGFDRVLCINKSMFMDKIRCPSSRRPYARPVKRLGSVLAVSSNVLARNKTT
jgi:hypothetical protein